MDKYSFELKAFMLTLACLLTITHRFWTENPLPESYLLKRNYARYPFKFEQIFLRLHVFASCKVGGVKITSYRRKYDTIFFCNVNPLPQNLVDFSTSEKKSI